MFGLYINGLQHHVAAASPNAGPAFYTASYVRVSLLTYAVDTAILANSAQELQQLMTSVEARCSLHGMAISIKVT